MKCQNIRSEYVSDSEKRSWDVEIGGLVHEFRDFDGDIFIRVERKKKTCFGF